MHQINSGECVCFGRREGFHDHAEAPQQEADVRKLLSGWEMTYNNPRP